MDHDQPPPSAESGPTVVHAPPETLDQVDERIDRDKHGLADAIDAGDDGQAFYFALDLERCRDLRRIMEDGGNLEDLLRANHRRALGEQHQLAVWAGDRDVAEIIRQKLERLERGQRMKPDPPTARGGSHDC